MRWGVLPSLVNLTSLAISYPDGLFPKLAARLIPEGVRALCLSGLDEHELMVSRDTDPVPHLIAYSMQELTFARLPASLRFVYLAHCEQWEPDTVKDIFYTVRVMRINDHFFTVKEEGNSAIAYAEPWPASRVRYYAEDWLEWFGCEDAVAVDLMLAAFHRTL
jgi:hypothetical protein